MEGASLGLVPDRQGVGRAALMMTSPRRQTL